MFQTFLNALASAGGNVLMLYALVVLVMILRPTDQNHIDMVLGALLGILGHRTITPPSNKPPEEK